MKRLAVLLATMSLSVMWTGCGISYRAGLAPIPKELLKTDFTGKSTITLINDYGEKASKILIETTETNSYYGDLRQITGASITLLSEELTKRGMLVQANGDKMISLRVKNMFGDYQIGVFRTSIILSVAAANGYSREFVETNSAWNYQSSFDGTISKVIAAVLNDENIVKYLIQGQK